jgi:hypothetical protein
MLKECLKNSTETLFEDNKRNNFEGKEDLKVHIEKTHSTLGQKNETNLLTSKYMLIHLTNLG